MFIVHLNIAVIFFIISISLLKSTAINIFPILSFNLFSKKLQLSIYLLFIDYIYGSYVSVVYDLFKIIIYKIRDRFYFFNIVSHFIYLNNISIESISSILIIFTILKVLEYKISFFLLLLLESI